MSKEISQEDLEEALEHHEDHPVTQEEFEIDEEWIRKMYEQLHKSASVVWKEEQNKIWRTK